MAENKQVKFLHNVGLTIQHGKIACSSSEEEKNCMRYLFLDAREIQEETPQQSGVVAVSFGCNFLDLQHP